MNASDVIATAHHLQTTEKTSSLPSLCRVSTPGIAIAVLTPTTTTHPSTRLTTVCSQSPNATVAEADTTLIFSSTLQSYARATFHHDKTAWATRTQVTSMAMWSRVPAGALIHHQTIIPGTLDSAMPTSMSLCTPLDQAYPAATASRLHRATPSTPGATHLDFRARIRMLLKYMILRTGSVSNATFRIDLHRMVSISKNSLKLLSS
jgi:hypothetical protein